MENKLNEVLLSIKDMEEKIKTHKDVVIDCVKNAHGWNGAESASTFATRLHGEIQYLNGMCAVLKRLGYKIEHDKNNNITGIRKPTEEE